MKVKSESEAAQSCPTFSDPMDFSPSGSSTHGIFQAKVLGSDAIAFSTLPCKTPQNLTLLQNQMQTLILCIKSSI